MKAIQCKELSEPDNWNTTIEFNEIDYDKIMAMLDSHFTGDPDEEKRHFKQIYFTTARRYHEPMKDYILRLEYNQNQYLKREPEAKIVSREYAEQLLKRSGLNTLNQKFVIQMNKGEWDTESIKKILCTSFKTIEQDDARTVAKPRKFNRPGGKFRKKQDMDRKCHRDSA